MMNGGRLKARDSNTVGSRIEAKSNARSNPNSLVPKFSFEFLSKSHCISSCQKDEKAALTDRLHQLSQLVWQRIQESSRHGQGCEIISRASMRVSIPDCITEDTNILAFRFFGKAPMVGFRREEVFYIVWLDRDFTVYDHS